MIALYIIVFMCGFVSSTAAWKVRRELAGIREQVSAIRKYLGLHKCQWCAFADKPIKVLVHEIEVHQR